MVCFIEKRKSCYDKENGDWWYATINAKGTVVNAGKVANCINCHTSAENDYVYGPKK